VRDGETWLIDDLTTVGEDIEIEGSRSPALTTDTPSHPFDLQKIFEKVTRSDLGIEANDRVEIVILVGATHRGRLVYRGTLDDAPERRQATNRIGEMAEPIADVGSDSDVGDGHGLRLWDESSPFRTDCAAQNALDHICGNDGVFEHAAVDEKACEKTSECVIDRLAMNEDDGAFGRQYLREHLEHRLGVLRFEVLGYLV